MRLASLHEAFLNTSGSNGGQPGRKGQHNRQERHGDSSEMRAAPPDRQLSKSVVGTRHTNTALSALGMT